ncbi:MAG: flotillin family protein [Deltaproteobacteria bacterium]|nr:flotillin family protein [Deltaproteobacteria bacterium]
MGFRDDGEAARARAEALERENRDLQQKIAVLQNTKEAPRSVATRSLLSSNWIIIAGIALILVGAIVIGSRSPLLLIGIGSVGLLLIGFGIASRFILIVGPNELLVLSGRKRQLADGSVVGYRVIRGGRVVRIPLLEQAARLSLAPLEIPVQVTGAYSKGGVPVDVTADATVKISSDAHILGNAIERFLGRPRDDIARVARETLEGEMRAVIAILTPKAMRQDRATAEQRIFQEVEEDFNRLGLTLDTFHLETIDDSGFS